ncbi:MAG: hypothetical protein GX963_09830 [Bacteroidales bacterium]|nr:hypothetical protein [Bacteroidales bacterium]
MNYDEERERVIEADQEFTSFPPPDYSKMTNEQIKLRTNIMKDEFERLFDENDQGNENEDDYL